MTGNEFRTKLTALGLSQSGFARYTGWGQSTVSKWTSNNRPVPRQAETVIDLLERFPVALEWAQSIAAPTERHRRLIHRRRIGQA